MREMILVISLVIAIVMGISGLARASAITNERPSLGAMIQVGDSGTLKVSTLSARQMDRELGTGQKEKLYNDMFRLKDASLISGKYQLNGHKKTSRKILALYKKLRIKPIAKT